MHLEEGIGTDSFLGRCGLRFAARSFFGSELEGEKSATLGCWRVR